MGTSRSARGVTAGLLAAWLWVEPAVHGQAPATQPASATQPAWVMVNPVPTPAPNPHWREDGCRYCHPRSGGEWINPNVGVWDTICVKCHDGVKAHEERHPVGRLFSGAQLVRPEGWPIVNDRLSCMTCHDLLAVEHAKAVRPRNNPNFLRGGPATDTLTYCSKCHVANESHGKYNPHVMLDDKGQILHQSCRFCHNRTYENEHLMQRTGDAALRANPIMICASCHTSHVEFFEPGHIGLAMTPEAKARMLSQALSTQPAGDPKTPIDCGRVPLPLGQGDRIVCSTCHNPHQAGTFPPGSPLSCGAAFPVENTHRLRGLAQSLCSSCHAK